MKETERYWGMVRDSRNTMRQRDRGEGRGERKIKEIKDENVRKEKYGGYQSGNTNMTYIIVRPMDTWGDIIQSRMRR